MSRVDRVRWVLRGVGQTLISLGLVVLLFCVYELKVTAAAILRHYPTKQALFAAAMRPHPLAVPAFMFDLAAVDAAQDPRKVLRNLAEHFVPFVQRTLAENLAVYMYSRGQTSIVLPFDPRDPDTPPRRGLKIVTEYFRRAAEAGVLALALELFQDVLQVGSLPTPGEA